MPEYTGPLGLGVTVGAQSLPTASTAGPFVFSGDQLVLDVIQGKTIYGGSLFTDTLGGFYPIVLGPAGITVNGSSNQTTQIMFHNSASSGADMVFGPDSAISLAVFPNRAVAGSFAFHIFNSNVSGPRNGFNLFGTSTYRAIQIDGANMWAKTHVVFTKAGVPADSDFSAFGAVDGMVVLDTTDLRLYVRSGGAWHYAALT